MYHSIKKFITLSLMIAHCITLAQFQAPDIPAGNQLKCYKEACQHLGPFACKDSNNRKQLMDACTRQIDSTCLTSSIAKLPSLSVNEMFEMVKLAKSCQYVDMEALKLSSKYLSSFETNEFNEVTSQNDAHWLASEQCIRDAHTFLSRYDLDELDQSNRLSRSCQGSYEKGCLKHICGDSPFNCDELDQVVSNLRYCVYFPSPAQRRNL